MKRYLYSVPLVTLGRKYDKSQSGRDISMTWTPVSDSLDVTQAGLGSQHRLLGHRQKYDLDKKSTTDKSLTKTLNYIQC